MARWMGGTTRGEHRTTWVDAPKLAGRASESSRRVHPRARPHARCPRSIIWPSRLARPESAPGCALRTRRSGRERARRLCRYDSDGAAHRDGVYASRITLSAARPGRTPGSRSREGFFLASPVVAGKARARRHAVVAHRVTGAEKITGTGTHHLSRTEPCRYCLCGYKRATMSTSLARNTSRSNQPPNLW